MNQFFEILNLELFHEYYINGKCKQMKIVPDLDTQQWIYNSGMQFIQKDNIGRLMIPDQFNLHEVLEETPDFELRFNGIPSNPEFINFTETPFDKLGKIVFKNEPPENNFNRSIELSSVFQADSNIENGLVSIQLKLLNLIPNQADWPVNYRVQFKSRLTIWKYYFISRSSENNLLLKLEGAGNNLFNGPTSVELPNNITAQLFDSKTNLLPFKEGGTIDLNLRGISADKTNNDGKIIVEHLPNANPRSLQFSTVKGKQEVNAAIYVYL